ncbi:putative fad binding domain-containing protein [Neofusicoccum parvum UCRNP2]|uniref:Putative fad binding domain-containing protein n=1 Tax=Botryosphaeria parva (strain UCR-NP2) TaxID=1287680 RepID=R1H008_BOTPV|nr:putative fad binding domain-containing protein [Neofusicoccum parvum UCRNP2]
MGSASEGISVMVIGAGSGGRLIAQGLRKTGIACTVFEQDASLDARSRDWDFGIYWAQMPLEACLPQDVRDRIATAQVDNVAPAPDAFFPVFNGATGEMIKRVPTPYYLRLRRREFSRVMGSGIDIRGWGKKYNKRLTSVDTTSGSGVTATFADGTRHTASLLVGAEGAHSLVRERLLGPEKGRVLHSPFVLSMVLTKLPAEQALAYREKHHRICATFHPNGTFLWIGVHDAYDKPDPADAEFVIMCSWKHSGALPIDKDSPRAIIRDMKRRGEAWAEPFRGIVQAIDEDRKAWTGYLPYWPTRGWEGHEARGRVTLAGDAAHPMTPHRGQGLNNAILDCDQLVKQIDAMPERSPEALARAVERYEEEMWKRGHEAVMSSLENSMAVHDWETLTQSPLFKAGVQKEVEEEEEGKKRPEARQEEVRT